MPTDDDAGSSAEPRTTKPVFVVPQAEGVDVALDFTTPGPFGDFAFTAQIPEPDGAVRERVYGADHTDEPAVFVEILQHWTRVAEPDGILAGLERAEAVLRFLTDDLAPTTQSENDFADLLRRGVEPLAVMNFLPVDHEHSDERGDVIVLSSRGTDLVWISRRSPRTTFTVPPSHLWAFVTGMVWRTYDHDSIPLSRLNTVAYESALASFRAAIRSRSGTIPEPDPTGPDGAVQHEDRLGTPELVQRLCDLLGTKLVAYLSSVADTRTVRAWADFAADSAPPDELIERLRVAYQAATLLSENDTASVIQAWFQGRNPLLDDIAPARVLRDGEVGVGGANVMVAARAFAGR
ncbi:hypothetical protein [Pimelobacter simplex]|uniref:hypothetical protein n=1 Tax=Nocardioides simplex TaxID=2045 RepID=UPI0021503A7E|nr:hypothetical protein [Pimelobacter simplex]UUW88694.1 hypothetical protein M0M43_23560 [Pimelobacter simplex]UUW90994.1 hypothetical protein M0M43_05790 [Pimelobacter simplex]UUW94823.1 hypothetical protein M0M48_24295 [Pimelobacter simplex]UUW98199.1 hypothetical protein M0M48_12210 [Pimelobacter simplex]